MHQFILQSTVSFWCQQGESSTTVQLLNIIMALLAVKNVLLTK